MPSTPSERKFFLNKKNDLRVYIQRHLPIILKSILAEASERTWKFPSFITREREPLKLLSSVLLYHAIYRQIFVLFKVIFNLPHLV